jgi:hypothetical protein
VDINIGGKKGKEGLCPPPPRSCDPDNISPPFSVVKEYKMAGAWYDVETTIQWRVSKLCTFIDIIKEMWIKVIVSVNGQKVKR